MAADRVCFLNKAGEVAAVLMIERGQDSGDHHMSADKVCETFGFDSWVISNAEPDDPIRMAAVGDKIVAPLTPAPDRELDASKAALHVATEAERNAALESAPLLNVEKADDIKASILQDANP